MQRRPRTLATLATLAALVLPAAPSDAACTSALPVSDKRLGSYDCVGVHPGMALHVPSKKYGDNYPCTAGFAFVDSHKERYLTFPGTCHLDFDCLEEVVTDLLPPPLNQVRLPVCLVMGDSEEEPRYKRSGPVVKDAEGNAIGRIVYAVNKDDIDFAIVRIDKHVRLDPAMPVYGGPLRLGVASGSPEEAYAFSAAAPVPGSPNGRTGILYALSRSDVYHQTEGFLSYANGSPVMKPDGSAVGYYGERGWSVAFGWGVSSYEPALARTQKVAKVSLKLMTAPLK